MMAPTWQSSYLQTAIRSYKGEEARGIGTTSITDTDNIPLYNFYIITVFNNMVATLWPASCLQIQLRTKWVKNRIDSTQ